MPKIPLNTPLDYIRAVPLKLVFLLTLLGLFLRNPDGNAEYYPFSNYPMYSQFDGNDYYVYIADQDGNPLPSKSHGITTPKIKKRFKKHLGVTAKKLGIKKAEVAGEPLEQVGITTLKTLRDNRGISDLEELQLFRVILNKQGSRIVKSPPEKIATMRIEKGEAKLP